MQKNLTTKSPSRTTKKTTQFFMRASEAELAQIKLLASLLNVSQADAVRQSIVITLATTKANKAIFPDGWDEIWQPSFIDAEIKPRKPKYKTDEPHTLPLSKGGRS